LYLSTVQPSYVGGEICESVFALRHRIDHGSVVVFLLSWPPLKKWWRTMVLASSKTVTAKIAMNKNFTNPSRRGFFSSEPTLFRFVVMSWSPADQSASVGLLGRAGCCLFLQV
jgi:Na+-transporting NADH:ubiquinone oxidoreductase subunit NqrB